MKFKKGDYITNTCSFGSRPSHSVCFVVVEVVDDSYRCKLTRDKGGEINAAHTVNLSSKIIDDDFDIDINMHRKEKLEEILAGKLGE